MLAEDWTSQGSSGHSMGTDGFPFPGVVEVEIAEDLKAALAQFAEIAASPGDETD